MKLRIITLLLFFIASNTFAQERKHSIEVDVLSAYPFVEIVRGAEVNRLNPNLFYTYSFNKNYKMVIGVAYLNSKYSSPCPASYCFGHQEKQTIFYLGLRRNIWQINNQLHFNGELNVAYSNINSMNWGAGGFSGGRSETKYKGFGLGGVYRMNLQYDFREHIVLGLNTALHISNYWVNSEVTNTSLDGNVQQPIITNNRIFDLYSNLLSFRVGYRW